MMGRRDVPGEELLERATANGYKKEPHQAEESKMDNTKYLGMSRRPVKPHMG